MRLKRIKKALFYQLVFPFFWLLEKLRFFTWTRIKKVFFCQVVSPLRWLLEKLRRLLGLQ